MQLLHENFRIFRETLPSLQFLPAPPPCLFLSKPNPSMFYPPYILHFPFELSLSHWWLIIKKIDSNSDSYLKQLFVFWNSLPYFDQFQFYIFYTCTTSFIQVKLYTFLFNFIVYLYCFKLLFHLICFTVNELFYQLPF